MNVSPPSPCSSLHLSCATRFCSVDPALPVVHHHRLSSDLLLPLSRLLWPHRQQGSDPLWHEQFSHFSSIANLPSDSASSDDPVPFKHFRNKQELQHSLRAAFKAMKGRIRTFHLVLGDWELAEVDREEVLWKLGLTDKGQDWRVGQLPTWLEREVLGVATEEEVTVEVHHHSDIFRDRSGEGEEWEERRYREKALPTFNRSVLRFQTERLASTAD